MAGPEWHWYALRSSTQGLEYTVQHHGTSFTHTAATCRSPFLGAYSPTTGSCGLAIDRAPHNVHAATAAAHVRVQLAEHVRIKPPRVPNASACRAHELLADGRSMCPVSAADQPLLDGRTQWHVLSATNKQPACGYVHGGPSSITAALDHDNISVTVDGEVVVGRRRSHRADVSRPHRQCPGRPPCP